MLLNEIFILLTVFVASIPDIVHRRNINEKDRRIIQ